MHALDALCPHCPHALWLHTDRCLAQLPGANRFRFEPCPCEETAAKVAAS